MDKKNLNLNVFKKIYFQEAETYFLNLRRKFCVDDANAKYFKMFCSYFSGDRGFEECFGANLDKGFFVFGGVGIGKTTSFKVLQKVYAKTSNINHWVKIVSCHRVVTEYNQSRDKDKVISYYSKGKMLLDDLGAEPIASNYGKEEIFIRILELRYEEFIERGTKTFITSNLDIEGVKERYGIRVYDRFFEMMNLMTMEGELSRR